MLTLWQFPLCAKSRAVRIALGELGLEFALVEENLFAPSRSFLAMNPAGNLPVLGFNDGSTVVGSYAIAEFLDEARADRELWHRMIGSSQPETALVASVRMIPGGNAEERAETRRLIAWFHEKCDREVTQELLLEKVRPTYERRRNEPPNVEFLRAAQANLKYHLSYIGFLADQRRWLGGDELSYADLAAAAHVSVADYLGEVDWERFPQAKHWYQRIKSRRSFRSLLGDRIVGLAPPDYYSELDF